MLYLRKPESENLLKFSSWTPCWPHPSPSSLYCGVKTPTLFSPSSHYTGQFLPITPDFLKWAKPSLWASALRSVLGSQRPQTSWDPLENKSHTLKVRYPYLSDSKHTCADGQAGCHFTRKGTAHGLTFHCSGFHNCCRRPGTVPTPTPTSALSSSKNTLTMLTLATRKTAGLKQAWIRCGFLAQ